MAKNVWIFFFLNNKNDVVENRKFSLTNSSKVVVLQLHFQG